MMSQISYNFDLLSLAQTDTELKKIGHYYIGPCPFCGGRDRFTIKVIKAKDLWICRGCTSDGKYKDAIDYIMKRNGWGFMEAYKYVSGQQDDGSTMPDRDKRVAAQDSNRKQIIDQKLAQFTTQEIWDALHRRMVQDEQHRQWWRKNGVTDDWQDYLSLGWTPAKKYISSDDGETHELPAYTIPYFLHTTQKQRKFVTMQYRLCGQVSPADRYRFEYGLGTSYYMTTPTMPVSDKAIVCEGAKKAIVTRIYTADMGITVLGVPSKSDFGNVQDALDNVGTVWIILDPDAKERNIALAESIGISKCRVLELPVKVDDALIGGDLAPSDLSNLLRQAVKL